MISFKAFDQNTYMYHHLPEDSDLIIPVPESCGYGTDDYSFYSVMKVYRDNSIQIKSVEISGKHLFMLALWSADFPTPNNYSNHEKAVYYTGDMANFIIYNYANWLVA